LVAAGVGLPPQLTNKRETTTIDARAIRFRFFFVIAKLVALRLRKGECNRRASFRIGLRVKLPRRFDGRLSLGIPSRETS